jgi:gamma-glutamylcyclotransferase (GGCT)/AIG2-like uncharacterized protein YtfP
MTRLFIYGTLKRGQVNHHLLASETFLSEAHTAPHYRLLNLGWYPGLARVRQGGQSIFGELWEVSSQCLQDLDAYEGDEYARQSVALLDHNFDTVTEMYVLKNPDLTRPDAGTTWNG